MGPHGRGAAYGWRARRDLPRIVVDCASFTAATLGERTNEKRQSSGVLMSVDIDPDLDGVLGALQQGQADWVLLNYGAASKDTLRLKNYGCNGVEELKVSLVSISLSREEDGFTAATIMLMPLRMIATQSQRSAVWLPTRRDQDLAFQCYSRDYWV